MPEVNNHNEKPWYRKSSSWAWITIGVLILTYIILSFSIPCTQNS